MNLGRRVVALAFLASAFGSLSGTGCSQKTTLGSQGTLCDVDEQCTAPLVCKCVLRRNPDEEGPDEIVKHGSCQPVGTKCANSDAGPLDARLDGVADVSDVSDSSEVSDAADANDASGDTVDETVPDGG